MDQRPDTVDKVVKATCVLHNMLRKMTSSARSLDSHDVEDNQSMNE